jgi:hypothetical protein
MSTRYGGWKTVHPSHTAEKCVSVSPADNLSYFTLNATCLEAAVTADKTIGIMRICRSQWPRGLRHELSSLEHWDRRFESHSGHGSLVCMRLVCVCVVLCVGSGLATSWSLVQGVLPSPTDCVKKRLWNWRRGQGPTKGCRVIDE